jgi:phosphate uptake regulator
MDFRSILTLFRDDDWSAAQMATVDEMLELSSLMFHYTIGVVVRGEPDHDASGELFARDRRINALVRQVRQRVISRLAIGASEAEIPSALVFMNVVKDAERIGDYVKNIHEIADLMGEQPDRERYREVLGDAADRIVASIDDARRAFARSEDALANRVIAETRDLANGCESAITEITDRSEVVREAVCLVLALRFFKRIAAHLSNIATTVVMPVDLLDFHDEPRDG